jgi:GAF domain-containing protein/HAMP domain-containing protein
MATETSGNLKEVRSGSGTRILRGETILLPISLVTGALIGFFTVALVSQLIIEKSLLHLTWLDDLLAAGMALCTVLAFLAASRAIENRVTRASVLIGAFLASQLILSSMVDGIGVLAALVGLVFTIIVAFSTMQGSQGDTATTVSIAAAIVTSLINLFPPVTQVSNPTLVIALGVVFGILVIISLILVIADIVTATLQVKLITAALAISLIPLGFLSFIQGVTTQNTLKDQNYTGLQLAAQQTVDKVDEFLNSTVSDLKSNANNHAFFDYLSMEPGKRANSAEETQVETVMNVMYNIPQKELISSIGLLDAQGMNLLDTDPSLTQKSERGEDYFLQPVISGQPYISSVYFSPDGQSYLVFSSPVQDRNLKLVGVLRVKYLGQVLQKLLESNRGLYGAQSSPILLDENKVRLGDALDAGLIFQPVESIPLEMQKQLVNAGRLPVFYTEFANAAIPELSRAVRDLAQNPRFSYSNPGSNNTIPYAGYVAKITNKPWVVAYVQRQDALLQLTEQQNRLSLLVATIIASLVAVATTVLSRLLSSPITQLTATAVKITSGDLSAYAVVRSKDEIGTLGNAFNQMTRQVHTLINELEDRVQNRTQELYRQNLSLQYRTQQLQTVSDVARSIASTQELQLLLDQVVMMISERFNFYHVGIFLLDDRGQFAVLRAANSEGGQRMLARQHRLKVGEVGIVGYAAGKGAPRIATDVGTDAVYFNNPDLPLTLSEMALPLKFGSQVIGVLDVQSTISNAFSNADIELFGILADQVAIAIMNNRLFTETNKALAEIQGLHRQYLRMEWSRENTQYFHPSYVYTPSGLKEMQPDISPELEDVLETGQPLIKKGSEDEGPAILAVPIILRGEPIGVIQFVEQEIPNRTWSTEEVNTVQSVADQVALALENVRLIEQTTRRAERERKVLEITSKIRATNDMQTMLAVAMEELQKALKASRAQVIIEGESSGQRKLNSGGNGHLPG